MDEYALAYSAVPLWPQKCAATVVTMAAFLVLRSGAWADSDAFLCRPLIGNRHRRPEHMPWVAVARGVVSGAFDLVRRAELTPDEGSSIVAAAETSLGAQPCTWQATEESGFLFFKKPSLVRASIPGQPPGLTPNPMDDLSSEQLLHAPSLMQAAKLLRCSELIAVVPKRGWLLVGPGKAGEFPLMAKMQRAAAGVFGRAGDDALSPYAFFVVNGQLTGANVVEGSGGVSVQAPEKLDRFDHLQAGGSTA